MTYSNQVGTFSFWNKRLMFLCFLVLQFPLIFISFGIYADPWGNDADLCVKKIPESSICSTPILGSVGEILIGFHQQVISPADGPRSHFKPSSSQYTLNAMRNYGFFQGYLMGCDRLMRENSEEWVYRTVPGPYKTRLKYDPVPEI